MKQETERSSQQNKRQNSRKAVDARISMRMSLIFLGFMLLISLFLIFVPRSTMSQVERRELTKWPEFSLENYFSGKYTTGITQFYDDTVPARDSFKNVSNNIKARFGFTTSGSAEVIGNIKRVEEQTTPAQEIPIETVTYAEPETTTPEETETTEEINSKDYHVDNYDAIMENGMVVVFQDGHWRGIPLYGGMADNTFSETVNYISRMINQDINVYVMPVPTSSQFYLPSNYAAYSADQEESYQLIAEALDAKIHKINIIETMNNHNQEEIYLRTDHHWAALGAYYAAREFAKEAQVPFADLDTYTRESYSGFVGTMYAYTSSANILNDPEEFVYYVPTTSNYIGDYYDTYFNYSFSSDIFFDESWYVSNAYSTFLGQDNMIIKITTDAGTGRSLLMIKDSFGNAEVPFLTGSFDTIYVIDQRYFDLNLLNFIAYTQVTDILFTHSYFATQGADAQLLENITYNNAGIAFYDGAPAAALPGADNSAQDAEETADPADTAAADPGYTDAGYYDTGYDAGYYDAGYDTGYYDAGYDAGYYDTGYYDAGYDAGYYDAGYYDAGY